MKLYTSKFSPNPRKVEIYLVEKGLQNVERVMLNLVEGEHRAPEYTAKNPLQVLPTLELDDGRLLTESLAIIEYLEELYPDPPLIGADPWQRAQTREAERIAELGMLFGAARAFEHSSPFFAKRIAQTPENAEDGRRRFTHYLRRLDQLLGGRSWLAGEQFTIADITAICAVDFGLAAGCEVDSELPHIARWLDSVRARPSCQLKRRSR